MSDLSRVEQLLRNALGDDIYEVTPQSRVEELLQELNEAIEGMGSSVSPEDIATAVSAYLDEHLTNPANPPVDTSLTIAGAAADAQKTGVEIAALKEELSDIIVKSSNMLNPSDTESGSFNSSGEETDASNYHRSANYIPVTPSTAYITQGLMVYVEYTSDKTPIKRGWVNSTTTFTTSNNCYFVRVASNTSPSTWRMNHGTVLDDTEYGCVSINPDMDYSEVFEKTRIPYNKTFGMMQGYVALNGGEIGDSTTRARSPLLNVVQNDINSDLVFSITSGISLTYKVCALYKDGVFVRNISSTLYNASKTTIPLDGTFNQFCIAFAKADGSDFTTADIATMSITVTTNISLKTIKNDADHNVDRIKTIEANEMYDTLNFIGKKYCALGDSITYGFAPRNCAEYGTQIDSYAKLTAEKLGMIFENYGIVGSTLAYHESRNPMSVRYTTMPNDADIITVMGGTNDIRNGIQLGTSADRTNETYYGALHVLLGGLYKKYFIDQGVSDGKEKKIVVCTPIKLLSASAEEQGGTGILVDMSAWVEAVKEVSAYYSFPVLDFYNLSGINPHLNETIQGTEQGYTGFYNPYITDGTHPTKEGQQMMANVLCGFLKSLM